MTTPDTAPHTAPTTIVDGPRGYLLAWAGALAGVLLLGGIGIAIGFGLAQLYSDPDAGLGNLWVLVFPIGLGALGTGVGMVLGLRTTLARAGDALATRTAWMTLPLMVLGFGLLVAWGLGLVVLLVTPVVARWLALRQS